MPSAPAASRSQSSSGESHAARVAAAHADDRDRLLAAGRGPDRDRGAALPRRQLAQEGGRRRGAGVVEDQGRGQPQPGGGGEPVAQLDRCERVEAEVLEGDPGVDRGGGGVAEDGGDVLGDQGRGDALALGRRRRGEELGERAAGVAGAAGGEADQPGVERRQLPRPRQPPQRRRIQRRGDEEGLGAPAGAIEELQALGVGDRLDLAAGHPRPGGLVEPAGHPALPLPRPPGDRAGRRGPRAALLGERIEEGVGGGVVGLAERAEAGGGRGEEDELAFSSQLVQVPGGPRLRRHHGLQARGSRATRRGRRRGRRRRGRRRRAGARPGSSRAAPRARRDRRRRRRRSAPRRPS